MGLWFSFLPSLRKLWIYLEKGFDRVTRLAGAREEHSHELVRVLVQEHHLRCLDLGLRRTFYESFPKYPLPSLSIWIVFVGNVLWRKPSWKLTLLAAHFLVFYPFCSSWCWHLTRHTRHQSSGIFKLAGAIYLLAIFRAFSGKFDLVATQLGAALKHLIWLSFLKACSPVFLENKDHDYKTHTD